MKVAVVGVGGVGGYFGGRLAESGADVAFLARGATLEALRNRGLRVDSPNGNIVLERVEACDRADAIGPVDFVIVGVKTWQVPDVADAIRPLVGPETAIVPLQNGVEAAEQFAGVHGAKHVAGGTCKIVAKTLEPGHIGHLGVEPSIAFGELDGRESDRVARLAEAFRSAGVRTATPPDIHVAIWEKFLFIAPVSGVGAVARLPLGRIKASPECRGLVERAMREVAAIAAARGVELPSDCVEKTMAFFDGMPPESTSSMQRDVVEGRPSELEAHNGALVRFGRELGVDVPVNEFIYAALLPQERKVREALGNPGATA